MLDTAVNAAGDSAGFEIVPLKFGGLSLRSVGHQETFHPVVGPAEEARILHVEQQRLVERATAAGSLVVWDVGLGAAANAVAAIERLQPLAARVSLHSFDHSLAPLEFALAHPEALPYLNPHRALIGELLARGVASVRPGFEWHFHRGNFGETMRSAPAPAPQAILYDPYSPTTNAEMWSLSHFTGLRARVAPDALLSNYTRSTAVRVTLLLAGFFVGAGRSVGEKAETTVAAAEFGALEKPLGRDWLARVKISRNAAPLRGGARGDEPIGTEDFARLAAHAQFS